jgi:Raf kinase inhibitor-like YbhB/YbcL family protein
MKKRYLIVIGVGIFLVVLGIIFVKSRAKDVITPKNVVSQPITEFAVTSSAFTNNGRIPSLYTCDGKNISPPLTIVNVPSSAKSLSLLVDDIDTPQQTWVHWMVWNIPIVKTTFMEGSVPEGTEIGKNSFGNFGYGGPCPTSGRHRYVFKVYALDTYVVLDKTAVKQTLIDAMNTHVIKETTLTGYYERNQ